MKNVISEQFETCRIYSKNYKFVKWHSPNSTIITVKHSSLKLRLYAFAPRHILTIPNQTILHCILLTNTSQAAGTTRHKPSEEREHTQQESRGVNYGTCDFLRMEMLRKVSLRAQKLPRCTFPRRVSRSNLRDAL